MFGMMSNSPSDADLLIASRSDPEAFGIFYRRHVEAVMRYLRWRVRDTHTAADLTAEVFAAALATVSRYRAADGPGRAWLFAIANHKLVDWQRRRGAAERARRRLGMPVRTFSEEALLCLEEALDARPLGQQLLGLVDDLPPSERAAVLAHVIDEEPYDIVAVRLGCSEPAARQRVRRGLARIRKHIAEGQS
jgi:RNA polymerase sigma factor (sigma-70 family)